MRLEKMSHYSLFLLFTAIHHKSRFISFYVPFGVTFCFVDPFTPTSCAQSSVASTIAQQYPVDTIMSTIPCLLLYPIGRAGKTKEVAKAQVHLARGLFEGKPIPIGYACVQVEQLLKSSYEDNEIDFPTADGKSCLGECVGTTILWHK